MGKVHKLIRHESFSQGTTILNEVIACGYLVWSHDTKDNKKVTCKRCLKIMERK